MTIKTCSIPSHGVNMNGHMIICPSVIGIPIGLSQRTAMGALAQVVASESLVAEIPGRWYNVYICRQHRLCQLISQATKCLFWPIHDIRWSPWTLHEWTAACSAPSYGGTLGVWITWWYSEWCRCLLLYSHKRWVAWVVKVRFWPGSCWSHSAVSRRQIDNHDNQYPVYNY